MITSTPEKVTAQIRQFCEQISPGTSPTYLKVTALPNSKKLECFENVQNQIAENGGSIQYGWRIWEWAGVMVEAEFHSVWVSSDGVTVDLTPADEGEILFLPDSTRIYEGKTLNNIRAPLANSPLVHEFIEVNNKISDIRIKAGKATNSDSQAAWVYLLLPLAQRQQELAELIAERHLNPNSSCFCGSGKKYKKCHKA